MILEATDPEIKNISLSQIDTYLGAHGWRRSRILNDKIQVYEGPLDDDGHPIEVILPVRESFADFHKRVYEVVRTLAQMNDVAEIQVANSISTFGGYLGGSNGSHSGSNAPSSASRAQTASSSHR
jgi:hypothetical protein